MSHKIDLFIVGAQKCGTTSLKNYLSEHDEINGQIHTEMTYFSDDKEYKAGFDEAYKKYFSQINDQKKIHIAKYVSLADKDISLERLKIHNPDCKIIYMVREPINRAYSSYMMNKNDNHENRNFDVAIKDTLKDTKNWKYRAYISYGFYMNYINRILKYFDKKNLKIIILEDFKKDPQKILSDIFIWLEINSNFTPNVNKVHNKGGEQKSKLYAKVLKVFLDEKSLIKQIVKKILPSYITSKAGFELRQLNKGKQSAISMSSDTKEILQNVYDPYNKELANFLNKKHPLWID